MISELKRPLVLASSSPSRAAILKAAGLDFTAIPARLDETALIESLVAEGAKPREIADALAEAKTLKVAAKVPAPGLVIGADQLLVCEGRIFEKPRDRAEAETHLAFLQGKTHELVGGVCGAASGAVIWRHVSVARLTLRAMDADAIADYLDAAGAEVLGSVGCYHLEGLGVHLMSRIDGDYFSILGLPILPVLDFLRTQGALDA
jgi:septum formation protein